MDDILTELLEHASPWDPALGTFASLRNQCRHDSRVTEYVTQALRAYFDAQRRVLALKAGGSDVAAYELGKLRHDLSFVQQRVVKLCPMHAAYELTLYMAELSVLGPHGLGPWTRYTAGVDDMYAEHNAKVAQGSAA